MNNKSINRARERLQNWSARGGTCPICHKDFRYGCNHSVKQAKEKLEQNVINALIDKKLKIK